MRIKIVPERCISSGHCVMTAPNLFGQTDEGVVRLRVLHPAPADEPLARKDARACPVAAIQVEEDREAPRA